MAQFVGQGQAQTPSNLIDSAFFPAIVFANFKNNYNYSDNISALVIGAALNDAIIEVDYAMSSMIKNFTNFAALVLKHQLDEKAVTLLHQRAVFNYALGHILATEITTNDTKNATDRVDNLAERIEVHNTSARQAIAMLSADTIMHVEVV